MNYVYSNEEYLSEISIAAEGIALSISLAVGISAVARLRIK